MAVCVWGADLRTVTSAPLRGSGRVVGLVFEVPLPSPRPGTREASASTYSASGLSTASKQFAPLSRDPSAVRLGRHLGSSAVQRWKVIADDDDTARRPWSLATDESMAAAVARVQGRMEPVRRTVLPMLPTPERPVKKPTQAVVLTERQKVEKAAVLKIEECYMAHRRRRREKQEAEAAAVRIQSVFRVKRAARKVQELPRTTSLEPSPRYRSTSKEPADQGRSNGIAHFNGDWCAGAELPPVGLETVWEMVASEQGHIMPHMAAVTLLHLYSESRRTGYNVSLYQALHPPAERADVPRDEPDPVDLWPRHVACIIFRLKKDLEVEATRALLEEWCESVHDPCGEMVDGFEDLGVRHDLYINLKLFRRLVRCISMLLCLEEQHLLSHLAWIQTGIFEIVPELGLKIAEKAFYCNRIPVKVQASHFTRLCHGFDLIDPTGRKGLVTGTLSTMFRRLIKKAPKMFAQRLKARPQMHSQTAVNYAGALVAEYRAHLQGWTEFSMLLQAVYDVMPKGTFLSPLLMCIDGLMKLPPYVPAQDDPGSRFEEVLPSPRSAPSTPGSRSPVGSRRSSPASSPGAAASRLPSPGAAASRLPSPGAAASRLPSPGAAASRLPSPGTAMLAAPAAPPPRPSRAASRGASPCPPEQVLVKRGSLMDVLTRPGTRSSFGGRASPRPRMSGPDTELARHLNRCRTEA